MKKKYMKPEQRVVKIQHQCIICGSVPTINPGEPNKPAGVKDAGDWDSIWDGD